MTNGELLNDLGVSTLVLRQEDRIVEIGQMKDRAGFLRNAQSNEDRTGVKVLGLLPSMRDAS